MVRPPFIVWENKTSVLSMEKAYSLAAICVRRGPVRAPEVVVGEADKVMSVAKKINYFMLLLIGTVIARIGNHTILSIKRSPP